MLKVTYTETGLFLDSCSESLETLLSDRVCVHTRVRRPVVVQPMSASIPLPRHLSGLRSLSQFAAVTMSVCDRDWVEVTLSGVWVAEGVDHEEGIFVAELQPQLEQRLLHLWQQAQGRQYDVASASSGWQVARNG